MPQHQHLALGQRQPGERIGQIPHPATASGIAPALVARTDLLHRNQPLLTDVVDRDIARNPQNPGKERHVAFLVFADHSNQLREHLLRDIFSLVLIVNNAAHVTMNVVRITNIKKPERLTIAGLGSLDRA